MNEGELEAIWQSISDSVTSRAPHEPAGVRVGEFVTWLTRCEHGEKTAPGTGEWTYCESMATTMPTGPEDNSRAVRLTAPHDNESRPRPQAVFAQLIESQVSLAPAEHLSLLSTMMDCKPENLKRVVYYLNNELGMSHQRIAGIALKASDVFSLDVDFKLRPDVDALLSLGISLSRAVKIVDKYPQFFLISKERRAELFDTLLHFGVSSEGMAKCISKHPQVLGLSVSGKVVPSIQFLVSEGGVPLSQVHQLIVSFPGVLGYSIEHNLRPKCDFLRTKLHLPREKAGAMILKFPQLLGLSLTRNIVPTIQFLTHDLGIPPGDIGKIMHQNPQLLGLNVEGNIRPKVDYLVMDLGVQRKDLARILTTFPTLLSLSIEDNLRPKVAYLLDYAGFTAEEIMRAPHLLAYSLEQRIKPRCDLMLRRGSRMALASLLSPSESTFVARHGGVLAAS